MSRSLETESAEYQKLREELLQAEIDLKDHLKRVAALREQLPADTPVTDHALRDEGGVVRLSELFEDPEKPLVLLHFMYGKAQTAFCPMCTLWADGYDGVVPHLRTRANFAVLVAGEVEPFQAYAEERGWRNLRIVSAADSSLKRDLGFEDEAGNQQPGVSVFALGPDRKPRHFYTGGAMMAEGHWNGMDLLSPLWHFLDLLPEGRGDFMPRKRYD